MGRRGDKMNKEINITQSIGKHAITQHELDPDNKFDMKKAKRNCKHCYGSGVAGKMHLTGVRLVCSCVIKSIKNDMEILNLKK